MAEKEGGAPAKEEEKRPHETELYFDVADQQWPIIYTPWYNIGFLGLEKLHPFDAGKWGRVYQFLKDGGMLRDDTSVQPLEASQQDLLVVHTKRYLDSLKWSVTVAGITEVPPVALLPNFVVQKKVLRPFRYQTGGTILAGKLALERGFAINVGGGFHHCCADRGGGFCAYADITLTLRFLFDRVPRVNKAMIIDLDAHQGNGHARDFMGDDRVYILDIYNRGIYPHDGFAKRGITRKIELEHFTGDAEYLRLVRKHVAGALNEFTPDIVVYNAGTDILDGDPLGCLAVSPQGIIERDQIVFQNVVTRGIPIIMVTSGGYQRTTARIIADSILNLRQLHLINCEEAEMAPPPPEPDPPSTIPRSASEGGLWARFRRSTNCMGNVSRSQTQENLAANAMASPVENVQTGMPPTEPETLQSPTGDTRPLEAVAEFPNPIPIDSGTEKKGGDKSNIEDEFTRTVSLELLTNSAVDDYYKQDRAGIPCAIGSRTSDPQVASVVDRSEEQSQSEGASCSPDHGLITDDKDKLIESRSHSDTEQFSLMDVLCDPDLVAEAVK